MASEINVLAHRLNEFSERNRHYRDFTLNSLVAAIREIIASSRSTARTSPPTTPR
jgi:(1->4)-alpha-D-glucan 1-alpha-D-glucosylmutase